ncbi:NUDIX hydrolase domain-like protein [Dunaliella salina]|uniref:isopentenyl-diphosphate Delta-isomerase n=1 Tax=Dunaliella salina TaxID=3046 RepID=A0ABQ7GEV6_DUNSA|nr:NUDIX hydrolase domain-like protein [Dunaliella salina]|eukprot:KAF5833135.1 NUDIX hydrolase domain-like protein [Dunaliella salina]
MLSRIVSSRIVSPSALLAQTQRSPLTAASKAAAKVVSKAADTQSVNLPTEGSRMATWAGAGKSQDELMLKDECILVDEHDNLTGSANKHSCHRFVPEQPQGQLHRAFSVFLFDESNRLLIQQRAKDKITFPSVWTNTCCSHPLAGQVPDEVDAPEQVADASVPGIKHAAVRKLQHELGIPPEQLPLSSFRFLTRLHYCAADTNTWGPQAEWGEHEVDYVLFIRAPVTLSPNAEEVDGVRYVTPKELQEMMDPSSGLLWSPWFRIIAEKWLQTWWADLEGVLRGGHQDLGTVHHIL